MITKVIKSKGISCKGRGFNCNDCKDKLNCIEYEDCPPISKMNIVDILDYKIYGKDVFNKTEKELFTESISYFVKIFPDSAKTLINELGILKEKAEKEGQPYNDLVNELLESLINGIEIEKEKIEDFKIILKRNAITKYLIKENRFIFADAYIQRKAILLKNQLDK